MDESEIPGGVKETKISVFPDQVAEKGIIADALRKIPAVKVHERRWSQWQIIAIAPPFLRCFRCLPPYPKCALAALFVIFFIRFLIKEEIK